MRTSCLSLIAFVLLACVPLATRAASPEEAAQSLQRFLDGVPGLGPGYAVVVVDREGTVLEYVRGQRDAASGAPLTADTPMYIASQTKAYVGLLAQRLDRRGVLHLHDRLSAHWPDVHWPEGFDPAAWTLADLLNHRVPLSADAITLLEAYVQSPDAGQYPALLSRHARLRAPGFDYDNFGYNLYAATLARHTGRSWQDWLDEEVLRPLDLARTSTRMSDFGTGTVAEGHAWLGTALGWEKVGNKPDGTMHAAGGMVSSPRDMGRWLRLHLGGEAPEGFDSALLAAAHRPGAEVDPAARNAYELPCSAYAFGWNLCDFEGHRLFIHGGGYTGARSMMAFAPDLGVGIGVFANSDNMTGWLTSRTVVQYLQFLVDHPEAASWAARRQAMYPGRVDEYLAQQRGQRDAVRGEPNWQGWAWAPETEELVAYAGNYRGASLPVIATIHAGPQGLALVAGALRRRLQPAHADLFGAVAGELDPPTPLAFERDAEGRIAAFEFQGERYLRVPQEPVGDR